METIVFYLTIFTILVSIYIFLNSTYRKRFKTLRTFKPGDTIYVIMCGKPIEVLVIHNRPDDDMMVCRFEGIIVDIYYEQIIININ